MKKVNEYNSSLDSQLIALLKASDHFAYEEIYERYFKSIFNQAYTKLGNEDTAKDIVQELFIHLWIKRNNLPHISNIRGYLSTSVRNRILITFNISMLNLNISTR